MLVPNKIELVKTASIASTNYQYRVIRNANVWGTQATSGVVDVSMDEYKVMSFRVATITSPSVGYRIEGRFTPHSSDRWIEIYTASKTAVMSIDEVVHITEPMYDVRVGWRSSENNATTDNWIYCDLYAFFWS